MRKFIPNRPEFIKDLQKRIILKRDLNDEEWYELLERGTVNLPKGASKRFYAYWFVSGIFKVGSLRGLDSTVKELVSDIFDSWIHKELGDNYVYSCSFSRKPVIGVSMVKKNADYIGPKNLLVFVYWNGKRWKLYFPKAGNWINIETGKPFGICNGGYKVLDKRELERQGCKVPLEKAIITYKPDTKMALDEFLSFESYLSLLEYVYD